MVLLTVGTALAEFPELKFALPVTYSELTQASQLTSVRLDKSSWTDAQELRFVDNAEQAYIINLESDEKVYASAKEISGKRYNNIFFTFPALTANGEYEVVIPAGAIETVEGQETNAEITQVYTLNDPSLALPELTPVTLLPAAGTELLAVNRNSGKWTVAFDPEIQKEAGYMKVTMTDADPNHLYEGEPFFAQIQLNRREILGTGTTLDTDLTEPFSFEWGGKDGSGIMYQGYEYKCRFEVRKSEYNEAKDGEGEVLGIYECTYNGKTMPEQYSEAKLVNITPTPSNYDPQNPDGYIFETTNDPHVTFFFDIPVEPNISLCGINTGSGSSVPFEGDAVSANNGKEWRFTIPKSQIQAPEVLAFFAFTDPDSGLPVKGNSGRGANSTFIYAWNVEIGLPTLAVVSPDTEAELDELSAITLSNSENYFFQSNGAPAEKATIQTRQGEVVAELNYSQTTFDNTSDTKTATLSISPAITEPGVYVLMVPKGYFTLSNNLEVDQYEEVYQNKALSIAFTVKGSENPETMNAKFLRSDPENNTTVTSLKEVEIFLDIPADSYAGMDYEMTKPALKNAAGNDVATTDFEFGSIETSWKMTFSNEITEPGVYSITFPDKFFCEDQTTNYTPAFTLTWTIAEPLASIAVVSPEPETELEQIALITLKNDDDLWFTAGDPELKATISTKQGQVVYTFENGDIIFDSATKTVKMAVAPEITDEGAYVLMVPQGYFLLADNADATAATKSLKSAALNAEFYVKAPEAPETMNAKFLKSDPENNTTVTSLKEVEIFFDIPADSYAGMDYEMTKPALKNAAGDDVASTDFEFGSIETSWKMTFSNEITEPGVYSITFPDKFFCEDQTTNYTPAFTLTWTIPDSGLSGVSPILSADDVTGDVYSIDGALLIRNATREDVSRLRKGVYLIGGRKYIVK